MIRFLQPDDALFSSPAYDRDRTAFDLLEVIRRAPLLLAGDGTSFAAGRNLPGMPAWLWTADEIAAPVLEEAAAMALDRLAEGDTLRVVAKPQAADSIAQYIAARRTITAHSRLRMRAFVNPRPRPPRNRAACIECPTRADLPALAACMAGFARECFGETPEADALLRRAEAALDNPLLLVVREAGEIAAMACCTRETAWHRAISQVYTRPPSRGRGYAAALAAELSGRILSLGKTPMLYADVDNHAAVRAYESVGFTPCGRVDELALRWEESARGKRENA